MKTRIIKSILTLALVFMAMPMMGQDYMEVYFKDGNKYKFFMPYVNKIYVSKYDAEGNLHNDYLYQHVITKTNSYVYELADIDYISYTDCDEEVVEQNIVSSLETVLPIIDECQSISDVEERIESIKNAESIEDAWSDGSQLCIKIKDWGVMSFHFHAEEQTDEAKEEQWEKDFMRKISSALIHKAAGTSPLKVAIANQTKNNDMPVWRNVRNRFDKISNLFKSCGITPVTVDPSIDFFSSGMFDYDVVVLCTHGSVMTKENGALWFDQNGDNVHFLFTSDYLGAITKTYLSTSEPSEDKLLAPTNTLKNLLDRKGLMDYLSKDEIRVDWIEELRGTYDYWVAYPLVTENFIIEASEGKEFQNPNSLIFAAVCHSLEGTHSLARKLQDRKYLNGYIGFDGEVSASVASNAALYYFMSLLSGNSMGKSEALIPDDYKFDTSWRKNTSLASSFRNEDSFLFPTFTNQVDQTVAQNAFNSSGYVEVEGSTTLSDHDADNAVSMGFMYGTDEDLSSATYISNVVITKLTKPLDNGHGNVVFRGQLTGLQPGRTYHYRAYTFDGMNYNYSGETCSFTIEPSGDVNLTDGLVAYYPFNGNANDASGHGNHGTPTENVVLCKGVNGDSNGAFQFGGYDKPGHIYVPNSESLKFSDGATFSAYIKVTGWEGMDGWGYKSSSGGQCIIAKSHDRYGWEFGCSGTDEGFSVGGRNLYDHWGDIDTDEPLPGNYLNKWTHVAITFGNGYACLYIDGQLIKKKECSPQFSGMNGENMFIGKYSDEWYPFNGVIDEVRIYNRALNGSEIQKLSQYAQ